MVHCPLLPIYQHPASGAFPCPESKIWTGHLSFPNLRSGTYRAWSLLRVISNGKGLPNVRLLVLGAQTFVVNSVPDFVPAVKNGTDPGLQILRSHYGPGAVDSRECRKGTRRGGLHRTRSHQQDHSKGSGGAGQGLQHLPLSCLSFT